MHDANLARCGYVVSGGSNVLELMRDDVLVYVKGFVLCSAAPGALTYEIRPSKRGKLAYASLTLVS